MHRWDVINHLIKVNNYKSYLEIGYYKGWSFDNIECEQKTAVDPNPCKTPEQEAYVKGSMNILHVETNGPAIVTKIHTLAKIGSDEFFEKAPKLSPGITWDIIFIDGLHEATQVSRDIENALKYLSPRGTIVLHDCNPPTLAHSTTGDKGGNWNGDVYKAFVKFRFAYPEYTTYTIDTDWGCGVIHTPPDTLGVYIDNLFRGEDINNFLNNWDRFDMFRKDLLNLISVDEFIAKHKKD